MSTDIFWSVYKGETPKAGVRSHNDNPWIKLSCGDDTVVVHVRPEQLDRARAAVDAFNAIFAKAEDAAPVTDEAA